MKIDIVTIFPEMFAGVFSSSMLKRAQETGAVDIEITDFREFSPNKHHTVDDTPYGGGGGMVLKPEPIFLAVESLLEKKKAERPARVILTSPQGEVFSQEKAIELSKEEHLIFICGHYEGYDERICQYLVTDEISIGDYVLTGGELPAMVIVDAVVRLLPGVLGNEQSAENDSFRNGLLEYPQYTRPAEFRGWRVPDVLLSGNHARIEEWRRKESLRRTLVRRPDLLQKAQLDERDRRLLMEIKREMGTP
jgi:tRNA (guanine37-N1)-methyltransferase